MEKARQINLGLNGLVSLSAVCMPSVKHGEIRKLFPV